MTGFVYLWLCGSALLVTLSGYDVLGASDPLPVLAHTQTQSSSASLPTQTTALPNYSEKAPEESENSDALSTQETYDVNALNIDQVQHAQTGDANFAQGHTDESTKDRSEEGDSIDDSSEEGDSIDDNSEEGDSINDITGVSSPTEKLHASRSAFAPSTANRLLESHKSLEDYSLAKLCNLLRAKTLPELKQALAPSNITLREAWAFHDLSLRLKQINWGEEDLRQEAAQTADVVSAFNRLLNKAGCPEPNKRLLVPIVANLVA